jgi:hypothetical protein
MTTRVLSIVGAAYRGTIEEQDDTVLWLTSMCSASGVDISVLLEANAVNYIVRGQDASGLRFGDAEVVHPAELDRDLEGLLAHGVTVHYVREDADALGLDHVPMIDGVKPVSRSELPALFEGFAQIWRW